MADVTVQELAELLADIASELSRTQEELAKLREEIRATGGSILRLSDNMAALIERLRLQGVAS